MTVSFLFCIPAFLMTECLQIRGVPPFAPFACDFQECFRYTNCDGCLKFAATPAGNTCRWCENGDDGSCLALCETKPLGAARCTRSGDNLLEAGDNCPLMGELIIFFNLKLC